MGKNNKPDIDLYLTSIVFKVFDMVIIKDNW